MKKTLFFFAPLMALLFIYGKCKDDEQIVDLPQVIQNYLNNNYAGYELEESEIDTLCTGMVVYEVELEESDDKELELTFDTEGNLLFTETEIAVSQLPTAVTSSIAIKYAGYSAQEAGRLNLTDGSYQFEVELKKGQTTLEVLFAADGTVICEETELDDDD